MVKDGEVVIVDEFTGRLMPGRRWSDGLAPGGGGQGEGARSSARTRRSRPITFQNYFREVHKLAGMTGTADTEAEEFCKIYNLDVVGHPAEPRPAPHRESGSRLPDRDGKVRTRS